MLNKEDARRNIESRFQQELDRFFTESKQIAKQRGHVDAPRPTNQDQHIRWLIRYQLGESNTSIAHTEGHLRERKAVEQAVKALAKRIVIPLRPAARRGRPRKLKT